MMMKCILLIIFSLLTGISCAETLYLEKGAARTIKMNNAIDTVFTSSPDIVDYQVVGEKDVIVYGVSNGRGDLLIVQNGVTRTINILVDPLIGQLAKQIEDEFPGARIDLKKVGDSYILSGIAADEESRDAIHKIVGEALNLEREVLKTEFGGANLKQMDYISFRKLQNRLALPMSNQVNVKISVVEINKTYADSLGIDWSAASQVGDFILNKFKFDATKLTTLIHALGNESVARVLAEPNMSVLSGETADFLVGGEVPVVTQSQNGSSVEYKEIGIKMFVAAKVENSQKVRLTLSQEVSNLNEQYIHDIPTLSSRKARTTIELADGESFILGGLLSETERESLSKIPYIGDIPILGALFRNTSSKRERTELVVVATVNLVKPIAARNIILPSFNRSSLLERFFNIDNIGKEKSRREVVNFMEKSGFIY